MAYDGIRDPVGSTAPAPLCSPGFCAPELIRVWFPCLALLLGAAAQGHGGRSRHHSQRSANGGPVQPRSSPRYVSLPPNPTCYARLQSRSILQRNRGQSSTWDWGAPSQRLAWPGHSAWLYGLSVRTVPACWSCGCAEIPAAEGRGGEHDCGRCHRYASAELACKVQEDGTPYVYSTGLFLCLGHSALRRCCESAVGREGWRVAVC